MLLMRLLSKSEYLIMPKGTKFTGKLGLTSLTGLFIQIILLSMNIFFTSLSGHGFKLAPVIGKVLYELAMGLKPSYDLKMFSLKRFDTFSSKL